MTQKSLKKILIAAALFNVVLLIAMTVRGGGYGIAGLTWDTELGVTRANHRVGNYTVGIGDRIRSVNFRSVHRDSDIRGVLRSLPSDQIWLEVDRADFRVAVPLSPELIDNGEIPAVLRGPYRVVAIDEMQVDVDMNLAAMADWMEFNARRPVVFTVSVPSYTLEGAAERVKRSGPILPVIILILTFAMAFLSWLRSGSVVMSHKRRSWELLGTSLTMGGVLLAFLSWHDGFIADSVLLPFGLLALCLWRPLSLFVHHDYRGQLHVSTSRYFRLGVLLPALILLLAALYGWLQTLPELTGTQLDGFVFDQLRLLILVAAGITVMYHIADVLIHAAHLKNRSRHDPSRTSPMWIASLFGSLFVVSGLVAAANDLPAFMAGGYTIHLGGLVAVQWLGDLAALAKRTEPERFVDVFAPRPSVERLLEDAQKKLRLSNPQYVCRFPLGSVVLSLSTDHEEGEKPRLVPSALGDKLAGLIELLDAEGGMLPRYKVVRGIGEASYDPFEGLDRSVGVEVVLPLTTARRGSSDRNSDSSAGEESDGFSAHLVNRRSSDAEWPPPPLNVEALKQWEDLFEANPETWRDLQASASKNALVLARMSAPAGQDNDVAEPSTSPRDRAILKYYADVVNDRYPIDEPNILSDELLEQVERHAASDSPMLILGEIGVGRGLTARWIHKISDWTGEFVELNCGTIPEPLLIPELTGSDDISGRLDAAAEGTICVRGLSTFCEETQKQALDLIVAANTRLIVIEAESVSDVEGELRIIQQAVDEAILNLSPLRERPQDIERAAQYFLHHHAMSNRRVVTSFAEEALQWLRTQEWPSNYHDLNVTVLDAVLRCGSDQICGSDLVPTDPRAAAVTALSDEMDLAEHLEEVERQAVIRAMERSDGNKSQAARLLKMKRTTFIRKLAKHAPDL